MLKISWLLLAIAIIAAFYIGWFGVTTSNDKLNDTSSVEFSVDKGKVKKDTAEATSKAQDLGQKIKEEAKDLAGKAGDLTKSNKTQLTLDQKSIELEEGAKTEITVTRAGGDQRTLQLGLSPSLGSNLLATGGLFEADTTSTHITVEAPKGARSGSIAIMADGQTSMLSVSVKQ